MACRMKALSYAFDGLRDFEDVVVGEKDLRCCRLSDPQAFVGRVEVTSFKRTSLFYRCHRRQRSKLTRIRFDGGRLP